MAEYPRSILVDTTPAKTWLLVEGAPVFSLEPSRGVMSWRPTTALGCDLHFESASVEEIK
jgi:hypothetical protein